MGMDEKEAAWKFGVCACHTERDYVGGLMATLLDDAQLSEALSELGDWTGDRTAISRHVHVDEDKVAGFLADLETIARAMNHDPDIERAGGDLTITMSTHSAGGVTDLDVAYARKVDEFLTES
jgi:4a-hydroxytetrahydrobiopterin dehydratase